MVDKVETRIRGKKLKRLHLRTDSLYSPYAFREKGKKKKIKFTTYAKKFTLLTFSLSPKTLKFFHELNFFPISFFLFSISEREGEEEEEEEEEGDNQPERYNVRTRRR